MKLYELLCQNFKKDDLKHMAKIMYLQGLSTLRKKELAMMVVDEMLKPEVMYTQLLCMSDGELEVFRKVADSPDLKISVPHRLAMDAISMHLAYKYCYFDEDDNLMMPEEVAETWRQIDQKQFAREHDKVLWIQSCYFFVETFYVRAPLEIFMKLLERKKGFHIKEEELRNISMNIPLDLKICEIIDDYVVAMDIFDDPDYFREILYRQGDKDYYIPTYDEIIELAEEGCLIHKKPYQDMKRFLIRRAHVPEEQSNDLLMELWEMIVLDDDVHGPLQWLLEQVVTDGESMLREVINLYMTVYNSTNMPSNRGYAPMDMPIPVMKPGSMPTIIPGSSHAAKLLKEAAPGIRKMGFEVDLDGDSDEIPIATYPGGINGPAETSVKKVYPNDPCPCGSGKKYKKCCGRR